MNGYHLDRHVLTHTFPTRRSSDLKAIPKLHWQQVGRCFQNILSCRSGAHENLTLVPLSSLARDEGKPFQTIKDVGHRCLTKLEGRGNDAWRSFAATIY